MVKTVLLVHDDLILISLLKKILNTENIEYTIAKSFDEVEKTILNKHINLVISNADVDGIYINEFIDYLKTELPHTPIFILNQMHQKKIRREIESLGVNAYLTLPLKVDELKSQIEKYL